MEHIDKYMYFLIEVYNTPLKIDWNIGPPLTGSFVAMDETRGRKDIYDRYCSSIDDTIWNVYSKEYDNKKIWVIYKKGITGETIFETIKYCTENFVDFL